LIALKPVWFAMLLFEGRKKASDALGQVASGRYHR